MKIAGIIGGIVVLVVTVLLIYLSRYGLFSSVNITEKRIGPYGNAGVKMKRVAV